MRNNLSDDPDVGSNREQRETAGEPVLAPKGSPLQSSYPARVLQLPPGNALSDPSSPVVVIQG
ncbi:hypothetical protein ETAA8_48390 [Anatilimnocola aggregata]|uniref:Uncharacterized protein n=1 Tax=Anatilimnocola aggregata TaxID=2528021 RepID=A0A517YHN9_9BACT|nr:hypothetical protein ETAA8_48390 [Anatilimnocola aggregata]